MTDAALQEGTQRQETYENLPLTERPNCVLCGLPVPQGESPAAQVKAFAGVKQLIGHDQKGNEQYTRHPSWAYQAPICPRCAESEQRKIARQRPLFLIAALLVLAGLGLLIYYAGSYILSELRSGNGINMGLALACVLSLALLRAGLGLLVITLERVFGKAERLLVKNGYRQFAKLVLPDAKGKAKKETPDNLLFVVDEEELNGLQAANRAALAKCGK